MATPIILASTSDIRAQLLQRAGVTFSAQAARVDEEAIRAALQAEGASPRDLADHLAESKAAKISDKNPDALVIGCDQILALGPRIFAKPVDQADALAQLQSLRGQTHNLYSAAVIYLGGQPQWRHVGQARMTMRDLSDGMLTRYIKENWHSIQHSVGGYKIEEQGIQLFSEIEGDTFTIQGLPLLPLLNYLAQRGVIET
ncbi:MAG: Maf family nucleotide pyrophosphatase [Cypionkella sp.]|nr:Maf family nucleotide pyrophosphatase [Cypionkella sp.]